MTRPAPGALASVFAPAKINLALHVVGRRADGYHALDSLVAFADIGDRITAVAPSATAQPLIIEGPFAAGLSAGPDNLVSRAAARFADAFGTALQPLRLTKDLPLSSGIGGGSADGAAALRLLAALHAKMGTDLSELALALGADGPMCLASRPLRARGIGEAITPLAGLPDFALVLANPGIAVSTPAVFRRLAKPDNPPIADPLPAWSDAATLAEFLRAETRNDLEPPALAEAPVIGTVRMALAKSDGCLLARMSGSGATVFGLYADRGAAEEAATQLGAAHPDWWIRAAGPAGAEAGAPRLAEPAPAE